MTTPFDLVAGVKDQIDSQAMISYKLFTHSKPLGAMVREMEGLFNRITPFDIKHAIWWPFCFGN